MVKYDQVRQAYINAMNRLYCAQQDEQEHSRAYWMIPGSDDIGDFERYMENHARDTARWMREVERTKAELTAWKPIQWWKRVPNWVLVSHADFDSFEPHGETLERYDPNVKLDRVDPFDLDSFTY